jgi:hypothetical protein
MFFEMDDPLSLFINVIDKDSGKSYSDMHIYLTEWNSKTKTGKAFKTNHENQPEKLDQEGNIIKEDISLPNAKTIIRIPKGRFNEEQIGRLISKEKDVEFIVDN